MVYLFYSLVQRSFLKREANKICKSSLSEINDFNYAKLDACENTLSEIVDACLEVPFLDNKKVVIVDNAYYFGTEKKKERGAIENEEKDFKKMVNYLKNPAKETDLIFLVYSEKLDARSRLYKALGDNAKIANFAPLKEHDWERYISQIVIKRNINISSDAIKELAKRTLNDRDRLFNELEKLMLYSSNITLNDVLTLISTPIEDNVFEIANALLNGDTSTALFTYNDLQKGKSTEADPNRLLSILASQFRIMNEVQYLRKSGKSFSEIAKTLSTSDIRCSIAMRNAKKIKKDISLILEDIYQLDLKIKSSQIDRFLGFELFLINFKKNYL